ncbi:hypothetical protein JOC95_000957 [Bacillus tianshenii]|uniref:DUF4845 domain-containing protein n=1 Tax=Sutcliffiella tianshenii TaxID=1463404 RepID=A0ABS2NXG3_9BACI|nr:hypothetical protein [Bacillus tianshenii]MBM7619108.1 hypothetical protein [Bacillus tianshenii]
MKINQQYRRIFLGVVLLIILIFAYSFYQDSMKNNYREEYQGRARLELSRETDIDFDKIENPDGIKVKKNVKMPDGLDDRIAQVNLIQFDWKDQDGKAYTISYLEYVFKNGATFIEKTERRILD